MENLEIFSVNMQRGLYHRIVTNHGMEKSVPNFEPTEVGSSWSRGCQRLSVGVLCVWCQSWGRVVPPSHIQLQFIPECGWENHGAPGVLMLQGV